VSVTAKVNPVAVIGSPAVGDQRTETLEGSPPLPEVMADFVNPPIIQAVFVGDALKVGRDTALFVPPTLKSETPEEGVAYRVGEVGQPSTVNLNSTAV
jgi:hypothetical protein